MRDRRHSPGFGDLTTRCAKRLAGYVMGERRMPVGLLALAIGGFGIGLTKFLIAGLLPQVASSFAVSEAAAGRLISGYALRFAVGAIALTAATARLPRGGPGRPGVRRRQPAVGHRAELSGDAARAEQPSGGLVITPGLGYTAQHTGC
jgi:hypothetical protein